MIFGSSLATQAPRFKSDGLAATNATVIAGREEVALQLRRARAEFLAVGHGWFGRTDEPAAGDKVFRPRMTTAKLSAVACATLLVFSFVTGSRDAIWFAAIPFLFVAQCFQRVEVTGPVVRRTGLRAVELDLSTTEVKKTGRAWWIELFFLGRCLELRDADRHGLLLESWLWSKATRAAIIEAARAANPAHGDSGAAHS
jgi:hypothetical protein